MNDSDIDSDSNSEVTQKSESSIVKRNASKKCQNNVEKSVNEDDWQVVTAATSESSDADEGSKEVVDVLIPMKALVKNQNEPPSKNIEKKPKPPNQKEKYENCITLDSSPESISSQMAVQKKANLETDKRKIRNKVKLFTDESFVMEEQGIQPSHAQASKPSTSSTHNQPARNHSTSSTLNQPADTNVKEEPLSLSEESSDDGYVLPKTKEKPYNNEHLAKKSKLSHVHGEKNMLLSSKKTADYVEPEMSCTQNANHHHSRHCRMVREPIIPCPCSHNNGPSLSPSSQRSRRKKVLEKLWQKRERKLKAEFVRKMKKVFCKLVDSLEEYNDEEDSDMSILSSSEDSNENECLPFKDKSHIQRSNFKVPKEGMFKEKFPTHSEAHHFAEDGGRSARIQQLQKETQYWKNISQMKPQLSPEELRVKELEEELEYWKKRAVRRSPLKSTYQPSIVGSSSTLNYTQESDGRSCRPPPSSTPMQVDCERQLHHRKKETQLNGTSIDPMPPPRAPSYESLVEMEDSRRFIPEMDDDAMSCSSKRFSNTISPVNKDCHVLADSRAATKNLPHHSYSVPKSMLARMKFTEKEKNQIVKYITDNPDLIECIKGNSFWVQMASELDTHRTWQSIKNNFFTNIMKNLEKFDISDSIRNQIVTVAKNYL